MSQVGELYLQGSYGYPSSTVNPPSLKAKEASCVAGKKKERKSLDTGSCLSPHTTLPYYRNQDACLQAIETGFLLSPHYPSQNTCLQAIEKGLLLSPHYPSQGTCLQAIETGLLLSPP